MIICLEGTGTPPKTEYSTPTGSAKEAAACTHCARTNGCFYKANRNLSQCRAGGLGGDTDHCTVPA